MPLQAQGSRVIRLGAAVGVADGDNVMSWELRYECVDQTLDLEPLVDASADTYADGRCCAAFASSGEGVEQLRYVVWVHPVIG
jgi:hypothetical protein